MKKKIGQDVRPHQRADNDTIVTLPGYPVYPENEDIYSQLIEEEDIDPENTAIKKAPNEKDDIEDDEESDLDEESYLEDDEDTDPDDDLSGSDLDIPGSELDDDQEDIGNEDEENNYYSLGGDNHNDLEEDQGS